MDPEEIFQRIRKSVVKVAINDETSCGIIIACKARSAYVIAYVDYTPGEKVTVQFQDGNVVETSDACYIHEEFYDELLEVRLLGIHCHLSGSVFDQDEVKKVDVFEEDADMCEEVYVCDFMEEIITEGYAMKVDAHHYNLTNNAGNNSGCGAAVVKKDGKLIGICSSFEYHLTARNMVSISDSIERSHKRRFTTVTDTLKYLDTII